MTVISEASTRSLLAGAVALVLPVQMLLAQGFEGTMSVHSLSMPPNASMEYFIKGSRLRLEISAPGQSPIVLISDGVAKKQYTMFPDQKMYTTTTFAELLQSTDSLRKRATALLQGASMTPSSKVDVVAGHKCTVHRYHDAKNTYDICLSTELGAVSGVPGLFGNITPTIDPSQPPVWTQNLVKAGSFALRVADTTGKSIWEVRKATAQSLAAALFSPPSDFVSASDTSKTPEAH